MDVVRQPMRLYRRESFLRPRGIEIFISTSTFKYLDEDNLIYCLVATKSRLND